MPCGEATLYMRSTSSVCSLSSGVTEHSGIFPQSGQSTVAIMPMRSSTGLREDGQQPGEKTRSRFPYEMLNLTWPYNGHPADLPRECGPVAPVEEVDQPVSSRTTAYPEVLSPVPEALDATGQGYSICGDLAPSCPAYPPPPLIHRAPK